MSLQLKTKKIKITGGCVLSWQGNQEGRKVPRNTENPQLSQRFHSVNLTLSQCLTFTHIQTSVFAAFFSHTQQRKDMACLIGYMIFFLLCISLSLFL